MPDIRWFINNGDYFYFGRWPKHISWVELDNDSIALTEVWQVEYLNVTLIPEDPVESVSFNWSSSDTSIATVVPSTKTLRLPSTYQEVEYIQSSGTQYIDTWVSAPNWFKTKLSVEIVASVNETLIGSHNVNSPYWRNNINTFVSGSTWGLHMNDEMINGLWSIVIWQKYEIEGSTILWASYLTVNWTKLTTGSNTSPMSSNSVMIFTNQYGIAHSSTCNKAKLYYCKIYNNSEILVRDLVPCYRKSDNVIWLYDLVNNQFYINSWSGVFTKWDDHDTYIWWDAMVICVTPWECSIVVTTNPWGYTDTCEVAAWELFDETNAAQSTTWSGGVIASPNGKFIRPSYSFGGGNGAYSIGTQDWYDVFIASWTHNNLDIWFSDTVFNSLISDYSKIKIIYDYFNVGSKPSSYTNQILFANNENVYANSGWIGKGSSFSSVGFALSTPYSMEQIINTSDMSTVTTVKNLNTQETWDIPSYTKSFWRETNSTYIINGWGNVLFHMTRDAYGWPVVMGNIHIYWAR